jgi:hypothetical protein
MGSRATRFAALAFCSLAAGLATTQHTSSGRAMSDAPDKLDSVERLVASSGKDIELTSGQIVTGTDASGGHVDVNVDSALVGYAITTYGLDNQPVGTCDSGGAVTRACVTEQGVEISVP